MTVHAENMEKIIFNLDALCENAMKSFKMDAIVITEQLHKELLENVAALNTDGHTLRELAAMGHPYGILPPGEKALPREPIPHGDEHLIHNQTGGLASAVIPFTEVTPTSATMAVYIDEKKAPYIKYLIEGTTTMVARPVIALTWQQVKSACVKEVIASLRRAMKIKDGTNI